MRRGTIVVIVFVVLAAIVVGASQFLRAQPPLEVTVIVSPLAEAWVRNAVDAFNATEPVVNATRRVEVRVNTQDDLSVWSDEGVSQLQNNPPAAWIPATSMSLNYANRLSFEVVEPSLAKTLLLWGGFSDRVDALTDSGARPLDWADVARAAEAGRWSNIDGANSSWGNINLAFSRPTGSMSGLAAVFSGAAAFAADPVVSGVTVVGNDFHIWIEPILQSVPNYATLGTSVAQTLAARGVTVGAIALLPESEWINNLRGALVESGNPIRLSYPAYPFVFDFPLARRQGLTADENAAVDAFAAWMLNQHPENYGLRPPSGIPAETAQLFTAGEDYGVQLDLDLTQTVTLPARAETQRLLAWVSGVVR
jgi:hypothetical protein